MELNFYNKNQTIVSNDPLCRISKFANQYTSTTSTASSTLGSISSTISYSIPSYSSAVSHSSSFGDDNNATIVTSDDIIPIKKNESSKIINKWSQFGTWSMAILCSIGVVVLVIGYCYHSWCARGSGSDGPYFGAIIRFFASVADFWTDLLFVVVLSLTTETDESFYPLLYCCVIFTLVPYIMSFTCFLYFTKKWKDSTNNVLVTWIQTYDKTMLLLTILSGFHTCVELFHSKLFFIQLFHLPIRRKTYDKLKHFQFINVVLLENIPQLVIQTVYITMSSNGDLVLTPIVLLSMFFSSISIINAVLAQLSRIMECICPKQRNFGLQCTIVCKITLTSKYLTRKHSFAHNEISKCIRDVLYMSQELKGTICFFVSNLFVIQFFCYLLHFCLHPN